MEVISGAVSGPVDPQNSSTAARRYSRAAVQPSLTLKFWKERSPDEGSSHHICAAQIAG